MSNLKTLSTFFNRNFSLTRLANALAAEFNAQYILDDIHTHFYDIETADGYWLDVWGRIVAMPRSVSLPSTDYFGFYGTPFTPFNHAPFYGGIPDLNNVTMDDTIYRKAIKAKALANRSGRAIPDINAVLALFLDATCYALDGYDMSITLSIAPSWAGSTELAVIMSDVLGLRPAGVKLNFVLRLTYAIAPDTSTINEADNNDVTFTVTTANVPDGTTLYYTALDITTEGAADLTPISGSVIITGNAGSFVISAIADLLTEGSEGFQCQLRTDSIAGAVVATSILITITDSSTSIAYTVTPSSLVVNEGAVLSGTISTVGIPDSTTLYWTILNGTTANGDFSAVSGSVVIMTNTASFNISTVADLTTEGDETFSIQLRTGGIAGAVVATSSSITIADNSVAPIAFMGGIIPVDMMVTSTGSVLVASSSNDNYTGYIHSSENAMASWALRLTTAVPSIRSFKIVFSKLSNGDVLCFGGAAMVNRSSNNGVTWDSTIIPALSTSDQIRASLVTNSGAIIIGTLTISGTNRILRSADNGLTYTSVSTQATGVETLELLADGSIIAGVRGTTSCSFYKSTDDGITWALLSTITGLSAGNLLCVVRRAGTDTLLVTTPSGIYRSTDSGATWSLVSALVAYNVVQNNGKWYIAVGAVIYVSSNDGSTWTVYFTASSALYRLNVHYNKLYAPLITGTSIYRLSAL